MSGAEELVAQSLGGSERRLLTGGHDGGDPFAAIRSACAIAPYMHRPLIPAGGQDLRTAPLVDNLQYMFEHPDIGENHNAAVFRWCYRRIGELIPELVDAGLRPRVMLECSGTLLHGLRRIGADDVLDVLRAITVDGRYLGAVEWLGRPWDHPVAPSTPVHDYALHVRAWQQHFAALFGLEALGRVRSFSPSEPALPNHPDAADAFARTLGQAGYRWVLVQERTVEQSAGQGPRDPHLPHVLSCSNSGGESASILALVKTQCSDTKLVAQMQPYYEAHTLERATLDGRSVPPLVTQIADGETGGVMMNELPPKYREVVRESSGSETPILNGTEYLERVFASGVREHDLPVIPPLFQHRICGRMAPGRRARAPGRPDRGALAGRRSLAHRRRQLDHRRLVAARLRGTCSLSTITSRPQQRSAAGHKQGELRAPDRCRPRPSQRSTCSGLPGSRISGSTGVVVGGAKTSPAR